MKVDFWFEFGSTYSYPAAMRIENLAKQRGIEVSWYPFLLGPIFHAQGWKDSPFNIYPVMGRYMWRDVERVCMACKIPFRRPSEFPRNGLLAARVACRFSKEPWIPEFVRAIYLANFSDDQDISSPETVSTCLSKLVVNPIKLINEAQSLESKTQLRKQTEKAVQEGIFGAPSYLVGKELFWGNDRLEEALSWAEKHGA
ncbi:MAG: 2-hydroxychromene-2-carboxylate isomerase [Gammaproteobacteria bacterium]|nr:2-hydroxychromene-2-carboxylate isomerase [Gammaproteobacteria bacterium]